MALDDMVDGAKDETKSDKVQELAEELGIEDKEDLEELNEQVKTLSQIIIALDKEVEELHDQVTALRSVVLSSNKETDTNDQANDDEGNEWSL